MRWVELQLVAGALLLAAAGAHGQPAPVQPFALSAAELQAQATALPKRDDFSATFLVDEQRYELDERHRLTFNQYQVYRVDSEDAVIMLGQVQAVWDPSHQRRPEIRARVVTSDGREHPFDPATLGDETVEDADPRIFTDTRLLRGPLPAIALGSVVEVQVRVVDVEPPFGAGRSMQVFLGVEGAVERTRVIVSAPASLALRHSTRLLQAAQVTEEVADGRRVVTLEQGPLALNFADLEPEAVGDQPVWPQFSFSTGESWEAVARAYAGMAEPFIRPDEVRALLPSGLPDGREARIARLLEMLHERVRYTGVEFGTGKLVPNPPSVTLKRHFGDCKDKAVVFASLLRAAGIPAELVLLNSSTGVDVDPDLPGIGGFDHMIVHVPGEDPLWIDPTIEHMKVGELPRDNRGRWALVIGETGGGLRRTPDARPGDHFQLVVRELRLADSGPADVHVSIRVNGSEAEIYRRAWAERSPAVAKQRDERLKSLHSAKSIAGFEFSDDAASGQLTYRFEARGVKAGHTYFNEAVVMESFAPLFSPIPLGLFRNDETLARIAENREKSGREPLVRTVDWVFEPFLSEMQIRIVPPTGFRPLSLPEGRALELGPARFSSRFERDSTGSVVATVRVESESGRYTVEQGEAFRKAFVEHVAEFQLELRFEHETTALIRSGDEPGALRRHREFIAEEPGKAIHLLRAANHLIDYGLITEARDHARRATRLEPTNALAFSYLGFTLEHNEAGQRFAPGFDRDGALRAHREAMRLDPEFHWYQVNVASVAEYDADGIRFGPGADLELALAGYRKYIEKNPDWESGKWYVISCLWEMGRYDEIAKEAIGLPDNSGAHPIRLAARVMTAGTATALREEASRGDPATRRKRIENAVQLFWQARHYDQARELLAGLGGEGRVSPGIDASLMPLFRKAVRTESLPEPPATAAGVAESLMRTAVLREPEARELAPLLSSRARWNGNFQWFADHLHRILNPPHAALLQNTLGRREVARDVALSSFEYQESEAPGDLRMVTVFANRAVAVKLFLVPGPDGWRILTLAPVWHPLGREVLARLDAGDTVSARALLELVREEMETDERFSQSDWPKHFARALPRSAQNPDEATFRLAALFLMVGPDWATAGVEDIRAGEALATTADQRAAWHWLLYVAAQYAGEPEAMIDAAGGIDLGEAAEAETHWYLTNAQGHAGRWQDAERTSRASFEAHPSNERALRSLVGSLNALGRGQEALELLASLVRRGRSSPKELNFYAWQALVADAVDDDAVQASESSFNRYSRQNYSTGQTLACLYAVSGRETEARDLTRKLLEQFPYVAADNDSVWLIRGLMFERLGETAAAMRAYGEIEAPKYPDPGSVFAVASSRLAKLKGR